MIERSEFESRSSMIPEELICRMLARCQSRPFHLSEIDGVGTILAGVDVSHARI